MPLKLRDTLLIHKVYPSRCGSEKPLRAWSLSDLLQLDLSEGFYLALGGAVHPEPASCDRSYCVACDLWPACLRVPGKALPSEFA